MDNIYLPPKLNRSLILHSSSPRTDLVTWRLLQLPASGSRGASALSALTERAARGRAAPVRLCAHGQAAQRLHPLPPKRIPLPPHPRLPGAAPAFLWLSTHVGSPRPGAAAASSWLPRARRCRRCLAAPLGRAPPQPIHGSPGTGAAATGSSLPWGAPPLPPLVRGSLGRALLHLQHGAIFASASP